MTKGQTWSDDAAQLKFPVLHDVGQNEQMGNQAQNHPAALVVNGLRNCGLLDDPKQLAPTRVGKRTRAAYSLISGKQFQRPGKAMDHWYSGPCHGFPC